MSFADDLHSVRSVAELQPLIAAIPYAKFLGFSVQADGANVIGRLGFTDRIIGNPHLPAIHGGALGAFLELTAMCQLLTTTELPRVPKIVNISIDYLRGAQPVETFARAIVTRHGRRLANVRAYAYQTDADKPVASANVHFLLAA